MSYRKVLKGSLAMTVLRLFMFFPTTAAPLSSDIRETEGMIRMTAFSCQVSGDQKRSQ